jgi:cytosine/adenosine deaminase-related metal-dependent hydrolase
MAMRPFLARVTAAVQAMTAADFEASAAEGALECLRAGVTCVGDIAYGPGPLAACAGLGLGGVFHWEVLGIAAEELEATLAARGFPADCAHGRARCGISPHTPYTCGPALLRRAADFARGRDLSFAVHVAESPAERELMLHGTGALADTAARLARGFTAPGVGSVAYLERLGVLPGALAVHCVSLEPGDAERLAAARGVALCPRSNAYLGNGAPPVAELRAAGVTLALGTDSAASNWDLDLFAEARALLALDAALTPRKLLRMLTRDGARALGLDDTVGALTPGLQADLAVVGTGPAPDPEAAVMAAGVWRVRGGEHTQPTRDIGEAAAAARGVAERAIERS